jgi:predicted CopG family antitoxin
LELQEVKRAVEAGAKIIKSRAIAYFHNGGRYFSEYVETLYERRRRSSDEVERIIIKDLLNHLYGRMGLRLTREQLEFDCGQENVKPYLELQVKDKLYRLVKKEVEIKSFSNVAIAAWTTAQARLRLYDTLLKPCEKTIHYTDTDSAYTPQVLEVSDRLGDIKKEAESLQACFLLPKTYIAGSKIAFKGFENRKVQHFKIDDFEAALNGDLRLFRVEMEARGLNKFKTGLHVGDLLSKRKASVKSIKSRYDKRIVFRDSRGNWETRPIILGKGK